MVKSKKAGTTRKKAPVKKKTTKGAFKFKAGGNSQPRKKATGGGKTVQIRIVSKPAAGKGKRTAAKAQPKRGNATAKRATGRKTAAQSKREQAANKKRGLKSGSVTIRVNGGGGGKKATPKSKAKGRGAGAGRGRSSGGGGGGRGGGRGGRGGKIKVVVRR